MERETDSEIKDGDRDSDRDNAIDIDSDEMLRKENSDRFGYGDRNR
tara:strand:+ start:580 stop:717 length:138 start_codon:yes stop_codon:yes gene_type:complete